MVLQAIISQLRQDDDPVVQQEALTQLCELLSVSSEEALSMLPVESLVPILVSRLSAMSRMAFIACMAIIRSK